MTRILIRPLTDSELVRYAISELEWMLPRVWRDVMFVAESTHDLEIVLGCSDQIALEGFAIASPTVADSYTVEAATERVLIAGADERGVLYGTYEFLEQLGIRFYLSGPSFPAPRPADLPAISVTGVPEVKLRGFMPYTDFLTGPSTWDAEDYSTEIDNAARLRLNLFSMHFYTFEPVGRFSFKGVTRDEAYWDTSRTTRWRKRPGRISDFVVGGEHFTKYKQDDAFGSASALRARTAEERFDLAEADISGAYARAKSRGMTTTIGIEVTDPPIELRALINRADRYGHDGFGVCVSSPDARDLLQSWIEGILRVAPDVDVISLWQSETGPARWTPGCPCDQCVDFRARHPLPEYVLSDLLGQVSGSGYYVSDIRESAQTFLQWVLLGYEIIRSIAPDKEVALAGWFVEHLFADIEPYVPQDLILSSMTEVDPWEAVPFLDYYANVSNRRWLINWWEIDFRMWLPQPKVSAYPPLMEKVREYQVEAVIWQHWRTRSVDDNARYSALAMWDPTLSPRDYYTDVVSVEWGVASSTLFTDAMLEFEAFEQWLCHDLGYQIFAQDWFPPLINVTLEYLGVHGPMAESVLAEVRDKLSNLPAIRDRLTRVSSLLLDARAVSVKLRPGDRPGFWQNRVEYYLLYVDCLEAVGQAALHYADATRAKYPAVEKTAQLTQAYWRLRAAPVRQLIQKLSDRVECRGDLGTIVNLNNELWSRYKLALDSITQWFDEVGPGEMWSLRITPDGTLDKTVTAPDAVDVTGQWGADDR